MFKLQCLLDSANEIPRKKHRRTPIPESREVSPASKPVMKRNRIKFSALLLGVSLVAAVAQTNSLPLSPIATGPFTPDRESFKQYQCPEWFRDAKLGIWAVWGVSSVPMQGDWYSRRLYLEGSPDNQFHLANYGHPSKFGVKDLVPLWKAEKWNPDQLMALYQKAGARYFFGLAVFCDNIDYWDSKYHRWNSVNMGPHRDIMGEWSQAARKRGLRFGVSEHLGDWWHWLDVSKKSDTNGPLSGVSYDGNDPAFADLYSTKPQPENWLLRMNNLVDRYQPDLFYTDGKLPYANEAGERFLAHYYNQGRLWHDGKDEVVYNCKETSQGRWVQDLERGVMAGINPEPWQTDTCIADWHYKTDIFENHAYRTTTMILQMLADIVSKNGNLLLNFPPRPDGTLDEDELKILSEMAAWMAINGEAIFGTRPWKIYGEGPSKVKEGKNFNENGLKYTAQDIRFTQSKDGKILYAIDLDWPTDGRLVVKSLASAAGKVNELLMLGHAGKLDWRQTADGLIVMLPPQNPGENIFAVKIAGENLQPVTGN